MLQLFPMGKSQKQEKVIQGCDVRSSLKIDADGLGRRFALRSYVNKSHFGLINDQETKINVLITESRDI